MNFKTLLIFVSINIVIGSELLVDKESRSEQVQMVLVKGKGASSGSGSNFANYNEPCNRGKICDTQHKGLVCVYGFCKCQDYAAIHEGKCYPVASSLNDFICINDWACHNSELGPNTKCQLQKGESKCICFNNELNSAQPSSVQLINGKCLTQTKLGEKCEYSGHCSAFIPGLTKCALGVCRCMNGYVPNPTMGDCLTPSSKAPGSFCTADAQCSRSMGQLSHCKFNKCECYDTVNGKENPKYARTTGFINGQCFYSRKMRESCSRDEECQVGAHENAVCSRPFIFHSKACRCDKGKNCEF